MPHSRYRCLFCGAELDERRNDDFTTLRSNVCEQCWQATLEKAENGNGNAQGAGQKTELFEMILPAGGGEATDTYITEEQGMMAHPATPARKSPP
jgi:DNA-directed RNA polymerase subunit RPC12/RpoP